MAKEFYEPIDTGFGVRFITSMNPQFTPCPKPDKQSPVLPEGKWACGHCNQTGVIPCDCYSGQHTHTCPCCKGEGVHVA